MSAWYYNMFIILMSVFMCMSGVLLTALAYRPKQISENWWDWTNRFYESGKLLFHNINIIININSSCKEKGLVLEREILA